MNQEPRYTKEELQLLVKAVWLAFDESYFCSEDEEALYKKLQEHLAYLEQEVCTCQNKKDFLA